MLARWELIFILLLIIAYCAISTSRDSCEQLASFIPNMCHVTPTKGCQRFCNHRKNKTEDLLTCGRKRRRFRRIVGGLSSEENQWPWHATLQTHGKHICGASVLSERFLITAAHCVDPDGRYSPEKDVASCYTVAMGTNTHAHGEKQKLRLRRIYAHKDFKANSYLRYVNTTSDEDVDKFYVVENDIALLETTEDINFSNEVHQVCLPDLRDPFEEVTECQIIGWGYENFPITRTGVIPNRLRHATLNTVALKICNAENSFRGKVSAFHNLCAGFSHGKVSPCTHDSGGSLACKKNGTWYQRGITSSGYKCGGPDSYSIYTNVRSFLPWIIKTVTEANYTVADKRTCSRSASTQPLQRPLVTMFVNLIVLIYMYI